MKEILQSVDTLKNEIEKTKQVIRETEETIKKISGRENVENRPKEFVKKTLTNSNVNNSLIMLAGYGQKNEFNNRTTLRGRLGPYANQGLRVRQPSYEEEEDDKLNLALPSFVITAEKKEKSRDEVIEQQKKDREGAARNRRMFGMILGTLEKFKVDEKKKENQEKKRKEVEKKLEVKEKEQIEMMKNEKQKLFLNKKQQQLKLKQMELKMELVQLHQEWEEQYLPLLDFIQTTSKPHIFYLPKTHNEDSIKKLDGSREVVNAEIEKRRKILNEEIEEIIKWDPSTTHRHYGNEEEKQNENRNLATERTRNPSNQNKKLDSGRIRTESERYYKAGGLSRRRSNLKLDRDRGTDRNSDSGKKNVSTRKNQRVYDARDSLNKKRKLAASEPDWMNNQEALMGEEELLCEPEIGIGFVVVPYEFQQQKNDMDREQRRVDSVVYDDNMKQRNLIEDDCSMNKLDNDGHGTKDILNKNECYNGLDGEHGMNDPMANKHVEEKLILNNGDDIVQKIASDDYQVNNLIVLNSSQQFNIVPIKSSALGDREETLPGQKNLSKEFPDQSYNQSQTTGNNANQSQTDSNTNQSQTDIDTMFRRHSDLSDAKMNDNVSSDNYNIKDGHSLISDESLNKAIDLSYIILPASLGYPENESRREVARGQSSEKKNSQSSEKTFSFFNEHQMMREKLSVNISNSSMHSVGKKIKTDLIESNANVDKRDNSMMYSSDMNERDNLKLGDEKVSGNEHTTANDKRSRFSESDNLLLDEGRKNTTAENNINVKDYKFNNNNNNFDNDNNDDNNKNNHGNDVNQHNIIEKVVVPDDGIMYHDLKDKNVGDKNIDNNYNNDNNNNIRVKEYHDKERKLDNTSSVLDSRLKKKYSKRSEDDNSSTDENETEKRDSRRKIHKKSENDSREQRLGYKRHHRHHHRDHRHSDDAYPKDSKKDQEKKWLDGSSDKRDLKREKRSKRDD